MFALQLRKLDIFLGYKILFRRYLLLLNWFDLFVLSFYGHNNASELFWKLILLLELLALNLTQFLKLLDPSLVNLYLHFQPEVSFLKIRDLRAPLIVTVNLLSKFRV